MCSFNIHDLCCSGLSLSRSQHRHENSCQHHRTSNLSEQRKAKTKTAMDDALDTKERFGNRATPSNDYVQVTFCMLHGLSDKTFDALMPLDPQPFWSQNTNNDEVTKPLPGFASVLGPSGNFVLGCLLVIRASRKKQRRINRSGNELSQAWASTPRGPRAMPSLLFLLTELLPPQDTSHISTSVLVGRPTQGVLRAHAMLEAHRVFRSRALRHCQGHAWAFRLPS